MSGEGLYWWHFRLLRLLREAGAPGLLVEELAVCTGDLVTDTRRHLEQLEAAGRVSVADGLWMAEVEA